MFELSLLNQTSVFEITSRDHKFVENSPMPNIPKTFSLLCLITTIQLVSGCYTFQSFSPKDRVNKKQLEKLPESEAVLVANYLGTQTGTQLRFRKDSLFVLRTNTAFGWEQFNGIYSKMDDTDTFSLLYLNDHPAKWKYLVILDDKALLKVALNDSLPDQTETFHVVKNILTK